MRTKFIVFFFVLSLASCKCGLLNWFNKWTDELEMKNDPKCRERREAAEQGIIPEIGESSSGKKVSLLDIEEGQSTSDSQSVAANHGQRKLKRCPILGLTKPIGNSILGSASPLTLSKRGTDNIRAQYEKQCSLCRNQLSCKIFGKCDDCSKYCKHDQTFTNDPTTSPSESFLTNRMSEMKDSTIFKTPYRVASTMDEKTKKAICEIIGIKNVNDIDRIAIWVTTISNNPPRVSQIEKQSDALVTPESSSVSSGPNLKPRFNELDDSGEESQLTNMRNFSEDEKLNPSLIEDTAPFLRSSQNTENLKSPLIGSTNKEIIVQPKEFQSDESDEVPTNQLKSTVFERLTTPRANVQSLEVPKPKGGFIQNLLKIRQQNRVGSTNGFRPTPTPVVAEIQRKTLADESSTPSNSHLSDINEALQEVKAMVKNIQEEAQKASEKRLLGSTNLHQDSPSNLIPPQALDHIKDVNKYLINRAQDALDTVKHPEDNGETVGSARDDHSDTTKRVIHDLKKMPEFLLTKLKDTLNGFDTSSPTPTTKPDEEDQTTLQQRLGEDNAIVSLTEPPGLDSQPSKSYKNKLEKYLAQLKEQRQNKYNPEKFIKPVPSRINIPLASEATETPTSTDIVGTTEEKPKPILKLEELLKNRLKSFNEKINKPEPTTKSNAETLGEANPSTPSLLDIKNLKNNHLFDNHLSTQKTILESRNSDIEESKRLLKEKMQKYINSLKSPAKVPNTEDDRLKSVFRVAADSSQQDKLKQKIKDYVASLKTPLSSRQSQSVDNLEQPQLLGETAPTTNQNSLGNEDSVTDQTVLLQARSNFNTDHSSDSNLGKIVQTSSNPQDIFYVGANIKVPMKINKHENGTLEFTVDLDKLCSCQNSTCPKNHTNIEETVGTILEKEAELEMQLNSSSPSEVNQGSTRFGGFNKLLKRKSGIFKRSPEFSNLNNLNSLPVSPRLQEAASDLNTIKNNLHNSVKKLEIEAEKVRKQQTNHLNSIITGTNKDLRNFDLSKFNDDYIRQLEREKTLQKLRLHPNVLRNRFSNKINDDLVRLSEPYQQTQINALQTKLKNVENKVKKYEDKNEKMLADEAKAVFDIRKDNVVQQEVNLVNKVLSWINNLSKPDKK